MFFYNFSNFHKQVVYAKNNACIRAKDEIEWNGQDVIMRLDPDLARFATDTLSSFRVWPKGIYRYYKRIRVFSRNIIRSDFTNNFLILCVVINTVVLSMDHYGMSKEEAKTLEDIGLVFTYIFIVEMGVKLFAIGIKKYCQDNLNYIDGFVVIMSIVELIFSSGGGALSAFRTIRIFRVFRVLRIGRLLKSMKSMMNIVYVL